MKTVTQKTKRILWQFAAFATTSLVFASSAFASTKEGFVINQVGTSKAILADEGLNFLNAIVSFLQGPIMQFAGIAAIIALVIMFVVGEGQGWFKSAAKIVIPLVIFTNIGTILSALGLGVTGALI